MSEVNTDGNQREQLAELTAQHGWSRHVADRVDVYIRGATRIRVIWAGDDLTGGSRYQDDLMEQYSREAATVQGWLTR
ncbi:hypothetical protein C1S82_13930 [Mycolicibacterium cosmeticum]|uniref:Uncharacterized protein n=1 Tax=Mycolicibacterium cosmeticum TaxID=258533 RepID=W9ARM7_MYCCO|nr:hypothetical protein [Mycolicibacterium cosmeticum]TLH73118.1 hypothetical protein C1S82_13930 [Mycolicibacterium cosmeticum]CDO05261.1 hypothetical protein BN977_00028 [Mycolicibacterium cosmeticum]